jgi:hemimethylated DNA binding protein
MSRRLHSRISRELLQHQTFYDHSVRPFFEGLNPYTVQWVLHSTPQLYHLASKSPLGLTSADTVQYRSMREAIRCASKTPTGESLGLDALRWIRHVQRRLESSVHQRLLGIAYDYDVGDVVVHKHLGQLGVVVDQLPICFESDEWIQSHLGSVSDARVFLPWYIIAVAHHENVPLDFTRYGSQLSHRLVSKKMSIGLHRLLPLFFEGYDPGTGKYLPRKRRQSVASEPVKDSDIDLFEAHRVKLAINPMAVQQC